jgi:hypothetical protein
LAVQRGPRAGRERNPVVAGVPDAQALPQPVGEDGVDVLGRRVVGLVARRVYTRADAHREPEGWLSTTSWVEMRAAKGDGLDAALDTVLRQGRALIASLAGTDGAERADRVDRLTDDELRAVAYAAGEPSAAATG